VKGRPLLRDVIRLDEQAAARLLLVRAIEMEDRDSAVLTAEDRAYASQAAVAGVRARVGERGFAGAFLARRAEMALERLTGRNPSLARYVRAVRWPLWLTLGLPLLALMLGLSTDAIAGERFNILAFPLLGLIAWNVLAYLVLAVRWLMRRVQPGGPAGGAFGSVFRWLLRPSAERLATQPTLERGLVRFAGDWAGASGRLTDARVRRTLHLSAALFAVGVIAAMLLRARYFADYSAGWASTWAGAEVEIAALLGVVLAPASWLTGLALPDAQQLRALRGTQENAGKWLLLWSVTAALFVIVPRLVLAVMTGLRAAVLARRLPVAQDFYFRSLVRNAVGEPGKARLVAYGLDLDEGARGRLDRMLGAALGERVSLSVDPPVPYGHEDEWMERHGADLAASDYLILLFSLSSTPEAENHGAFAAAVRKRLQGGPTSFIVLLEEGALKRRLQGAGERRLGERRKAWGSVLAGAGLEPTFVSLDAAAEDEAAQAMERALARAPAEVR
jgi:hypothetical protein